MPLMFPQKMQHAIKQGSLFAVPNVKKVEGYAHSGFDAMKTEFARILGLDERGGAALAIYYKGELVADLWGGEKAPQQPWQADTMALSFSVGKGMLSLLVHLLVSEGRLSYDEPIASYWPEFGVKRSNKVTLRHVLNHQSGLYDIRHIVQKASQMYDWPLMLNAYANAVPRFTPGSRTAYQALSYGWILGGLVEKVTQKTLAQAFQHYVVDGLGLDGAYFGVPDAELHRVARSFFHCEQAAVRADKAALTERFTAVKPLEPRHEPMQQKLMRLMGYDKNYVNDATNPVGMRYFDFFADKALKACIPGANGVFTARSLAKTYAMLANGGLFKGHEFITAPIFDELSHVQRQSYDRVMNFPMQWRLGYHRVFTLGKRAPEAFGHMGVNGASAFCDPERNLAFAYIHNFSKTSFGFDFKQMWLQQRVLQLADTVRGKSATWI